MTSRPDITPGPPRSLLDATADVVGEQAKALKRQRRAVRQDEGADAVHDLRVAIRRIRTALRLARGHVAVPAGLARRLRRLDGRLAEVRDRDVLLGLLNAAAPSTAGREERERLARLVRRLERRRERAMRSARRALRGGRWKQVRRGLAAFADHPAPLRAEFALAARVLGDASETLGLAIARREAMTAASPSSEALHELRIGFKRLRDTLDAHAATSGLAYDVERRLAAELQDTLGGIHDRDEVLRRLQAGRGRWKGPFPALTARLVAERARLMRRFRRLRGDWTRRTRPDPIVVPLEPPRFVNLEVQPVTLRLVAGPRIVA